MRIMSYSDTLLCILGLFVVSYIPRILPFALLSAVASICAYSGFWCFDFYLYFWNWCRWFSLQLGEQGAAGFYHSIASSSGYSFLAL